MIYLWWWIYILNFNLTGLVVWQPELFKFFESGFFLIIFFAFLCLPCNSFIITVVHFTNHIKLFKDCAGGRKCSCFTQGEPPSSPFEPIPVHRCEEVSGTVFHQTQQSDVHIDPDGCSGATRPLLVVPTSELLGEELSGRGWWGEAVAWNEGLWNHLLFYFIFCPHVRVNFFRNNSKYSRKIVLIVRASLFYILVQVHQMNEWTKCWFKYLLLI